MGNPFLLKARLNTDWAGFADHLHLGFYKKGEGLVEPCSRQVQINPVHALPSQSGFATLCQQQRNSAAFFRRKTSPQAKELDIRLPQAPALLRLAKTNLWPQQDLPASPQCPAEACAMRAVLSCPHCPEEQLLKLCKLQFLGKVAGKFRQFIQDRFQFAQSKNLGEPCCPRF